MKIVIIGDSLIFYPLESIKNSYSFILKRYFQSKGNDEIFICGNVDNHSRAQSSRSSLLYNVQQFEPDIVIIHLGINDCAPRLFTEIDELFIRSLPIFIKMIIIRHMSKYRFFITKKRPKVHVQIIEFKNNYMKILQEIKKGGATPIIVNIAKPAQRHLKRSYNLLKNVKMYNSILSRLAEKFRCILVDLYSIIESEPRFREVDGIHLSDDGHKKLAEILIQKIQSIKN